jgi:hypothetical protein
MLDEVELWDAVTTPRQFVLAQDALKAMLIPDGILSLDHLIDCPTMAGDLLHPSNMRLCGLNF